MRLFTAILLEEDIKEGLYDTVAKLKELAAAGSFTAKENLHLTVNFIGETGRLEEVKKAMGTAVEKARTESFLLTLCGFGRFKRPEGDICWIGVNEEPILWRLQRELVKELKEAGFFDMDDREYKPHLTLGRRVRLDKGTDYGTLNSEIEPVNTRVTKLSLMKSERIQGKLTYTEIFRIGLNGPVSLKPNRLL